MALLPSDRNNNNSNNNNNNNNISSNTTTTSILVGATCGVIGVVVGLAIPFLLQRLITLGVTIQSKNDTTTTTITSSEGRCKSTTDGGGGGGGGGGGDNGTHSVRSGLKTDSIRINQSKLNSFLSNILIKAATTSTSTSTTTTGREEEEEEEEEKSTTTMKMKLKEKMDLVASVLTYADSRGIPSHGSNRCDTYVNEIVIGLVNANSDPKVEKESGCCAVINGNNGLGAVTSKLAMTKAIQLSKEYGVAVVTCHSSNHYGAAGYWAQIALDNNMIGMSFTNTSPFAVPTRGKTRAVGTNPFCFFAPAVTTAATDSAATTTTTTDANIATATADSFQLDMATSAVPVGKVEVMDRIGHKVPIGWGVDENGEDCTDPKIICQRGGLYPLGGSELTAGYKGYGLGMFVEIICSVLSGTSHVGPDVQSWNISRDGPLHYGHCFIVIDPTRFADGFDKRLGDYLTKMRNLPSDSDVMVAGDPEKQFENDAIKNGGIVLHESVAITLKALAVRFNVHNIPPELQCLDENKSKASLYE